MNFALALPPGPPARAGGNHAAETIMSPQQNLLLVHAHHGSLMIVDSAPHFLSIAEIEKLGRRWPPPV